VSRHARRIEDTLPTQGVYETVVVAADGDAIRRAYEAELVDVVEVEPHARRR
jgi:hypothetical protein